MPTLNFEGPFLKVERANQHIKYLEVLLKRYIRENTKVLSPKNQERMLKLGRPITTVHADKHTSTVLGDAVHNLRSSLDHAYCILIKANGRMPDRYSTFPFGHTWVSIKGMIDGKKDLVPHQDVIDFIRDIAQPHKGGNLRLYDLHELDITDKHKIILPVSSDIFMSKMRLVNPDGTTYSTLTNISLGGNKGSHLHVEGRAIVYDCDIDSAFDITFDKGQPFEGEGILETIQLLRNNVLITLEGLEKFTT